LSAKEGKDEEDAANRFLLDGALLVVGADGVVAPGEVAWLESRTSGKWSSEELTRDLSKPEFRRELQQRVEANASILCHKLSELGRARLLHVMCDIALCAGGIPEAEFEVIDFLRQQLKISAELAQSVLSTANAESQGESKEEDAENAPPTATEAGKSFEQPRYRYNQRAHLDLLEFLTNYGAIRFCGGLDLAASLLNKPGKMNINGSMVEELYERGQMQEIANYCTCDVLDTYFVFLRTRFLLGDISLEQERDILGDAKTWALSRANANPGIAKYLTSWDKLTGE
jgi:hypothetical protein